MIPAPACTCWETSSETPAAVERACPVHAWRPIPRPGPRGAVVTPYLDDGDVRLYHGDAAGVLAGLPDASVDCVVTSPPYFGLRDYGYPGQIGLEDTPAAFITRLVGVFREVRRVLAPHGTCWVNMGDSYANTGGHTKQGETSQRQGRTNVAAQHAVNGRVPDGYKPKDLLGIPWRLAFALQDDGWWLRSDVIWSKPNPMPESVTDRPTKAHEYLFLLTKAPRYWWDAEGVREPDAGTDHPRRILHRPEPSGGVAPPNNGIRKAEGRNGAGRNVRSVWTFPTEPNPEAHFATFPRELVRRCLAAGCPERVCRTCGEPSRRIVEVSPMEIRPGPGREAKAGEQGERTRTASGGTVTKPREARTVGWSDCGHDDYRPGVVLDPFIGSGTTAVVARAMGRHTIGIDGSADYLEIAKRRTQQLSLLGGG